MVVETLPSSVSVGGVAGKGGLGVNGRVWVVRCVGSRV